MAAVGDGERVERAIVGIVEVVAAVGFIVDSGHRNTSSSSCGPRQSPR
jgi:hypothetical protein